MMGMLQYAMENGIIDISCVEEKVRMNQRREYLKKHPYHIWEGKDGKWRTYLPDKKKECRLIKRGTQRDLENAVIMFYKNDQQTEDVITFMDTYKRWRSVQDKLVCENTISKYNTDCKRYFEDTEFALKDIRVLTEEDIKVFICDTVKEQKLCQKACKTLFGYIRNVFQSAQINHVIKDSPMEFLMAKHFYKYCTRPVRKAESRLVSDLDMKKLYQQFARDYRRKPSYIPTYAVEFATLTGMRAGEISALRWDSIKEGKYILVDQSEKYNRLTKEYFVDTTKNGKERMFPITKEVQDLLDRVKAAEQQSGYLCEWIFADEKGRIHAPTISSCSKNKCRQVCIDEKGIHAYRRTVNSKMRCEGVSAPVAASLMGHTEAVNEQYYTFDISGWEEKAAIMERINEKMPRSSR